MAIRKVPLGDLRPNPWQARIDEDEAHVVEVAASIVRQGLLQPPGGRPTKDGKVELAYGMTRLAAYKRLAKASHLADGTKFDPADYQAMPVDVRERTDREMFEQAVTENEARKALTPIERAQALARYMREFGASREQAGKLFGLQAGSVSHVLALLDLTPKVGALVQSGQLPERTARMFVGLSRLKPDEADRIAKEIVTSGEADQDEIAGMLGRALQGVGHQLATRWDRDGRVDGKWWKMDQAVGLTEPKPAMLAKALEPICRGGKVTLRPYQGAKSEQATETLKLAAAAKRLHEALVTRGITARELVELGGWPADVAERAAHLCQPPACTACDQHVVLAGSHYCLFKECYQAKRAAFQAKELVKARKGLAWVPIYERRDGKAVATDSWYWGDRDGAATAEKAMKQAIKEKHPDLRIRPCIPGWSDRPKQFTGSAYAEVVAVGGLAAALDDAAARGRAESSVGMHHQERDPAKLRERRRLVEFNRRLEAEAARHLTGLFAGISGIMLEIVGRLALGSGLRWRPDDVEDGEDDFEWQILPDDPDREGLPKLEPAERENLIRATLAERLVHWTSWYDAPIRVAVGGYEALAAPGGPLAGLVTFPAGWADEILAAYDRGDDPDAGEPEEPELYVDESGDPDVEEPE